MHNPKSGVVDPVSILVICAVGLAAFLFQPWKSTIFEKKPPVKQEQVDKAKLDAANARVDTLQKQVDSAKAQDLARKDQQVQIGQEYAHGALVAVQKAPIGPETAIAADLLVKTDFALSKAIGSLPDAQKREIEAIVAGELSGIKAQRDQAIADLKAKDAELNKVSVERDVYKLAVAPQLTAKLDAATKQQGVIETKYQQAVSAVEDWAKKKSASDGLVATLESAVKFLERGIVVAAILFAIFSWVLPALGVTFAPLAWLKDVSGYALSPFTHHDQKKQITAMKEEIVSSLITL